MPELDPLSFKQAMTDYMSAADADWLAVRARPIGLFLGVYMPNRRGIELQVDWLPWVSPRERMEATAAVLKEATKHFKVFIFADESGERFFQRLCRYRMLRNGCTVLNYFSQGEHAKMYYTAGPS